MLAHQSVETIDGVGAGRGVTACHSLAKLDEEGARQSLLPMQSEAGGRADDLVHEGEGCKPRAWYGACSQAGDEGRLVTKSRNDEEADMQARLECPAPLYRELVRWRARTDRSGDFEVSEAELRLAESRIGMEIPRDLLVLAVVRGETPTAIADMTLAAREVGVPADVVVFAEEPDMLWCGVSGDGRPTYVLGWHRAQGRLLPATVTLKAFVQLEHDADGSDEPVRIDPRHRFAVFWRPVLEVA